MDDFELPEDLQDIEVIYSDGEGGDDDDLEEMGEVEDDFDAPIEDDEPLEIVDLSKLTFTKHTKSVFSCSLSKDGLLALTGGEDDSAYLWSTSSGDVVLDCTGHKDSVTEVCFNYDNQLVATGDMAGMVQVWSINDKKLIWCFEGDDMEWLSWHPLTNVLLSGSQSGDIYIWQIPQGNCKILSSHGVPCSCGQILPDGKKLLAGYGDGQIKLWDIKSKEILWQYTDSSATSGIISLDLNADGSLLATAPSSTILKVVDGKSIGSFLVQGERAVEAILFNSELNVLITGSLSGQLCVWDLGRRAIRHQVKLDCAVTVMRLGLNGKVYIGATNGEIYSCDIRTGSLVETLTGHRADVLSLCVASDGASILTTSDDGTAKLFNTK